MRTWRVGTISMGAALLFLGVFLLLSQILHWDTAYLLASWWPVVLIILGGEILVYLFMSRQETPYLKFDFLSIFLVGLIGTAGIGFTVLQASGITGEFQTYIQSEVRTDDLPLFSQQMNEDITRIVVESGNHPLTVESTTNNEVSIFGTYQGLFPKALINTSNEYLLAEEKGDTLYLTFKELPVGSEFIHSQMSTLQATLVVPSSLSLELSSEYTPLTLKPRELRSPWDVTGNGQITMKLPKNNDIMIYAENVNQILGESLQWQFTEATADEASEDKKSAKLKLGNGEYPITLSNAESVDVLLSK
ncbi:hypothetical protein [Bacillus solitudinis]|uniref:hypothetical protein n=1 Tax=Bacillus solitudinis TaxID=2014074 RepID=UPI000C24867D|nr:hypothetical protein [Bacillus solitudinis]